MLPVSFLAVYFKRSNSVRYEPELVEIVSGKAVILDRKPQVILGESLDIHPQNAFRIFSEIGFHKSIAKRVYFFICEHRHLFYHSPV